jgi:hypothetical protein
MVRPAGMGMGSAAGVRIMGAGVGVMGVGVAIMGVSRGVGIAGGGIGGRIVAGLAAHAIRPRLIAGAWWGALATVCVGPGRIRRRGRTIRVAAEGILLSQMG